MGTPHGHGQFVHHGRIERTRGSGDFLFFSKRGRRFGAVRRIEHTIGPAYSITFTVAVAVAVRALHHETASAFPTRGVPAHHGAVEPPREDGVRVRRGKTDTRGDVGVGLTRSPHLGAVVDIQQQAAAVVTRHRHHVVHTQGDPGRGVDRQRVYLVILVHVRQARDGAHRMWRTGIPVMYGATATHQDVIFAPGSGAGHVACIVRHVARPLVAEARDAVGGTRIDAGDGAIFRDDQPRRWRGGGEARDNRGGGEHLRRRRSGCRGGVRGKRRRWKSTSRPFLLL